MPDEIENDDEDEYVAPSNFESYKEPEPAMQRMPWSNKKKESKIKKRTKRILYIVLPGCLLLLITLFFSVSVIVAIIIKATDATIPITDTEMPLM